MVAGHREEDQGEEEELLFNNSNCSLSYMSGNKCE